MTVRDLGRRLRALVHRSAVERELDDELAFHVECEMRKLVDRGIDPIEARRQAMARFGSRAAVADDCRDERGTGGVEAIGRDLVYAVRTWRRGPLAAVTIVLTVATGLALVTVAFTAYSAFFLRTDAVPHPDELFEVYRPPLPGADAAVPFTLQDFHEFRGANTVFRDVAAAVARDFEVRIDGRTSTAMLVDGGFFRMVGVGAANGRVLTPGDDQDGASPVIVLSERGWRKLFFGDPTTIGRTARVNGVAVEIVGIMPEGFRGLNIGTPDFWMPLAVATLVHESSARRPSERPVEIIGRLRAGVSRGEAEVLVRQWAAGPGYQSVDGQPLLATLRPRTGVSPDTGLEMLAFAMPLFFVFGLILLIACANVASLLLARSVARQRELGVRLSLGATRRRLVRQLLTEGLVLGAVASALAYPISRLLGAGVMSVMLRSVPPEFAEQLNFSMPEGDWRVLPFLIAGAVAATVMFGLLPALQATRLDPVRTMRGEMLQDVRPGRARRMLMVLQVGASTLLLICAAIFLRGIFVAAAADPQVRVADTVMVGIGTESRRAAVLAALAADPLITMISATSGLQGQSAEVRAVDTGVVSLQTYQFVSNNHFALLDVPLWRGRAFTSSEDRLDSGVVIVSDRVARTMWPGAEPIGRALRMAVAPPVDGAATAGGAPPIARTFTVVGVVRDLRGPGDFGGAGAGLYLPALTTSPGTELVVRVNEDPLSARTRLLDRLTRVDPALAHVRTLRSVFRALETILRVAFLVAVVLGGLALLLTVSGLFSVLSFLVQQRRKEIGVRMAVGASARVIAQLVLMDSARPVLMGAAGGMLLAGGAAGALMATPAAGAIGEMVQVLDPVAYVSALLVVVVACAIAASVPALRAARVDPMVTLRSE
jgi:predicted permease